MIAAVVAAVLVMMIFARSIGDFVDAPADRQDAGARVPASLIGVMLMADGFGHHVPKGYIYFAMAFSLFVEMLNLRAGHREAPVHLRQPYVPDTDKGGEGRPRRLTAETPEAAHLRRLISESA